ncbi:hypothetical protein EZV62_027424 [Acer yangbiense]|uniref:SWIM-type domain-containing protein n=1 Tax=Acer yangbiense TaxID=1000413 RepID=A0A5C7GU76_9ROSI|nr:hypothetical protein EZV62_027424 [Acer yangbiense]
MDKILTVSVLYGTEVLELSECDADHISSINLVHATTKEFSDSELLDAFRQFVFCGYDTIHFQIKTTHCPPSNTPHSPIDEPEVVEQIGWCNEEAAMFDCEADSERGDTESDEGVELDGEGVQTDEIVESKGEDVNEGMFDEFDVGLDSVAGEDVNNGERVGLDNGVEDEGVQTGDGVQNEQVVGIYGGYVVGDDEITKQYMALFNAYEFSKKEMRDIFREYTIRKGVTLGDLLLERYKVTVDIKKMYNVKHRVMSQLRSEHNSAFRQKGLIKALETHFLFASTRYCVRHIYANFRSSYPGDNYKNMFWKASKSSNPFHFNAALDFIGEYIRCDHMTNNMTEAFNSMLGTHRALTYLQLLEFIRHMLTIISAGDQENELVGPDGTFAVKLRDYHCGCGSWQISGIPCPHAMAVISHSCGRQLVNDWKMWPPIQTAELLPPPYETQPGRPKLQRKREAEEKAKGGRSGTIICKLCDMAGHNKRTCKSNKSSRK